MIAIALGGSAGALFRYWVANGVYAALGRSFPHGTLFVNVSGSFLMGLLTELLMQRFPLSAEYRGALLIGFLGAYTTFSTFAIETLYLFEAGSHLKAALNVLLSVVLCIAAVWAGLLMGRRLFTAAEVGSLPSDFPWLMLLLSLTVAFAIGYATELGAMKIVALQRWKAGILILALGVLATSVTLYYAVALPRATAGTAYVLTLFGGQALVCALALWAGSELSRQL